LHTLELDFDHRLWFFVAASSAKIEEMNRNFANVGLSYADPARQDYASITGVGEVVRDQERMKGLWSPWVKAWFPRGIDDPDLALLCVTIDRAEYWDAPGSVVKRFYGLSKARITGNTDALGEHRKLTR
jgi:general stress protein 26